MLGRLKDCLVKKPQTLEGLLGARKDLALWLPTPAGMACIWTSQMPQKNKQSNKNILLTGKAGYIFLSLVLILHSID